MLIRRFPLLCDTDFDFDDGQQERMLDKLSVKLKKTRTELESLFAELQTYWAKKGHVKVENKIAANPIVITDIV